MESLALEQNVAVSSDGSFQALLDEVRRGLSIHPKKLPPWLLYDARGSELFEQITELTEYYPSRMERQIFASNGDSIVLEALRGSSCSLRVVELGAGSAMKTGVLLESAMQFADNVHYIPIDISEAALRSAQANLSVVSTGVQITPVLSNYVTDSVPLDRFEGTTLALYIGSSIGNFEPSQARAILRNLRAELNKNDALLLGVDLVKAEHILVPAYDDAKGVTAAFNLNLLQRLNTELDANFELDAFRHRAIWNSSKARMEMHLESTQAQHVIIPRALMAVDFLAGETIHTENSYKYTENSIRALLESAGFHEERNWLDEDGWYSVTLARCR